MTEEKSKKNLPWITAVVLLLVSVFGLSTQFGTNGQIKSGGKTRKYLVYIPESYDPDEPAPLVISIHGFVQWPAHQQDMTGWNSYADEYGFLVVYPKGTGFPLRWNTRPSGDDPGAVEGELQFFSDLIDHLSASYNIDPARIYVNGMSNGGGMSDLLACRFSDRIAAMGGVAGAYIYPRENCHPTRPIPVIAFHGVDDKIVPYTGGPSSRDEQFIFPAVEDWVASWAALNSCGSSPEMTIITEEITQTLYTKCKAGAEVEFYRIESAGHTWPGGEKLPEWITGYTNQDIDATALMWEFFSMHSLELE